MQFIQIHPLKKTHRARIGLAIKILIWIWMLWYFSQKAGDLKISWSGLGAYGKVIWDQKVVLFAVMVLMPLNWSLEAQKWKILAAPLVQLKFKTAILGVISGLSFGFVTPRALGDYAGRVWMIRHDDRGKLIGAVWVSRTAQFLPTILLGLIGCLVFFDKGGTLPFSISILPIIWGVLALAALGWILWNLKYIRKNVAYYFGILKRYPKSTWVNVVLLSFARYLVFTLQFLLMLMLMDLGISTGIIIAGITWIFLIKSILPTLNWAGDLGVREVAAVMFFSVFTEELNGVIAASITLWVINLLLPVFVGAVFIYRWRIFQKS